eukprot:CAMPEP_0172765212 /NCGR_PEP_ID=MMETSP1074-20121228/178845_1 /TAXON_ID=2916 /ORGANISM="Ceratium fusus, Strain PA161109" /LENGTH=125 /DNA_ID=CAMNT_0013600125 /DNA_START=193 /DNA_END=570 /DNA_ORIENTATION=+
MAKLPTNPSTVREEVRHGSHSCEVDPGTKGTFAASESRIKARGCDCPSSIPATPVVQEHLIQVGQIWESAHTDSTVQLLNLCVPIVDMWLPAEASLQPTAVCPSKFWAMYLLNPQKPHPGWRAPH